MAKRDNPKSQNLRREATQDHSSQENRVQSKKSRNGSKVSEGMTQKRMEIEKKEIDANVGLVCKKKKKK